MTSIKAEGPTLGNITTGVLSGQDEGKEIKFTINRNFNSGKENKLFFKTNLGTATKEDLNFINDQNIIYYVDSSDNISGEINFKEFEDQKILKFKAILDNKNENDEYFTLNLFSDQTEFWANVNPVSSKAYINQVNPPTNYSYSISNNSPLGSETVIEGNPITVTITRSLDQGTATPTTIYLSTVNGLATGGADYEAIEELPIHFSTKDLQKTIIVNTKSDTAVESAEDFYLLLYQTLDKVSENKYDKYSQAYIKNDASISLSKYSLKSSASYTSPAEEGEDIVFTIFRIQLVKQRQFM